MSCADLLEQIRIETGGRGIGKESLPGILDQYLRRGA